MNSNYAFAFRKAAPVAAHPVMSRAPPTRAPPAPATNANANANANRFSINRLINLKPTGGCRSCN